MTSAFNPAPIAHALADAWQGGERLATADVPVADAAQAYAVQDAVMARLGPVAGWKVGAASDTGEPNCAPLPASALHHNGASLGCPARSLRGIELEVAVRLRADLLPGQRMLSRQELAQAIGEVMPAIELVDTRLAEGRSAPAMSKLADLQSHGALVLGAPASTDLMRLDVKDLHARLWFDGHSAFDGPSTHPAPDIWRLLAWLACHAQERGMPLRAGQVVTTGSCTGLPMAPPGARIEGEIAGMGRVDLRL